MENRIRELRLARGWTLEDLAERAGKTHFTTIGKLETGKMKLTFKWMDALSKAFDVPISEIFEPGDAGSIASIPIYNPMHGQSLSDAAIRQNFPVKHLDFRGDGLFSANSISNLSYWPKPLHLMLFQMKLSYSLNDGWMYIIADAKARYFLTVFRSDPARFVGPGFGTPIRDRVVGRHQFEIVCAVGSGYLPGDIGRSFEQQMSERKSPSEPTDALAKPQN